MPLIPQDFIDELVARADIVKFIEARGINLKRKGREYAACCPFHNEKTPSFYVSPAKQFYHCFGCGAHGTVIGFLMQYEGLDFRDAVETLADYLGMQIPLANDTAVHTQPRPNDELYAALQSAARYYYANLRHAPHAIEYLKQRGLSGEVARDFQIGYAYPKRDSLYQTLQAEFSAQTLMRAGLINERQQGGFYDRFTDRITFPIRDGRGRFVGFGARTLVNAEPKYLNSPETPVFQKNRVLYGLFELRQARAKTEQIIVVEGYMDVIALAQAGVRNVVATLGTATTEEHLRLLLRQTRRVVFCFDGDQAGQKAAWRALEQVLPIMRDGVEVAFLFLAQGDDPDSWIRREGRQRFEELTQQALLFSAFLLRELQARYTIDTPEGRAQLVREATVLLAKMPASIFKEQIFLELTRITATSPATVQRYMEDASITHTHDTPQFATKHPQHTSQTKQNRLYLTPVRLALRLLLESPELAQRVFEIDAIKTPDIPGVMLLCEIIELSQNYPHLTTAALLERMRERPEREHLLKLLHWEIPAAHILNNRERLFDDAILRLTAKRKHIRAEQLLKYAQLRSLTHDEKLELSHLLAKSAKYECGH